MNIPPILHPLTRAELRDLKLARSLLENPGFTIRLANTIGSPLEKGFALLPKGWSNVVNKATKSAMMRALHLSVATLGKEHQRKSREMFHKILAGASGGVGGVFGLAALPIELPISTAIMLRSIADIARSEGHNISLVQTKLDCLEVFALSGKSGHDDATESVYWVTRTALSRTVSEAATFLTQKGMVEPSAPILIRLVNELASRFGVVVSEEIAAKAVPIIGAASGSIINVLFIDHFQNMARGHFIVKRLEIKYGTERVREEYQRIAEKSA